MGPSTSSYLSNTAISTSTIMGERGRGNVNANQEPKRLIPCGRNPKKIIALTSLWEVYVYKLQAQQDTAGLP